MDIFSNPYLQRIQLFKSRMGTERKGTGQFNHWVGL